MQEGKMKSGLMYFILILCVFLSGCSVEKSDVSQIPQNDKQEIIRMLFETSIIKQQIPDYNLILDKSNIVISYENIEKSELPTIEGVTFELVTPKQIQQKAKREGDFMHLKISTIQQDGESYFVTINNLWVYQMRHLSGGGFEVKYTKKNGVWEEKILKMWISYDIYDLGKLL